MAEGRPRPTITTKDLHETGWTRRGKNRDEPMETASEMTRTTIDKQEAIERVARLLAASRSILFITGAGISADSGLPTFRGLSGGHALGTGEDGMPIERALAGDVMADYPEVTWKYLWRMERACRLARHNRAHEVIAQMERHFERVWTLTQNVDGLHRLAGARNVIDLHGDLRQLRCMCCRYRQTVPDYSGLTLPPRCPQCGAVLRPDIVLFGETLPLEKLLPLFLELDRGFDLVFSIGTSSVFPYVAEPVRVAALQGRPTVEINPSDTEVSDLVDIRLRMRAAPALDAVWRCYRRRRARHADPVSQASSTWHG
jgi:NAD-dependent deacetylase